MKLLALVLALILMTPANAKPTQVLYGGVNTMYLKGRARLIKSNVQLKALEASQDHRAPLPASVQKNVLRGYVGATYTSHSGELTYISPKSDLARLGVKAGSFILKIDRTQYRPCLMPEISIRHANDYLVLTIREGDTVREVIVKLKSAKELDIKEDTLKKRGPEACERPRK